MKPADLLHFPFRGRMVPVTYSSAVTREQAEMALQSGIFSTWYQRCEKDYSCSNNNSCSSSNKKLSSISKKRIEIHGVEIQSVDLFGKRVGFVKINSDCTLVEEVDGNNHDDDDNKDTTATATTTTTISHRLPGICFLRGNAVSVLVALFCEDSSSCYSLLVEQPRIPLGHVSCWELPAGMMEGDSIVGTAVMELEEECGIRIDPNELVDLTALSCQLAVDHGHLPEVGIATSPGGCDEMVRFLYLERLVTREELEAMKDRLTGLREQGEVITLRVVPMEDVWKVSGDAKAMLSQFLLEQLRQQGKLPPAGALAKPLKRADPVIRLNNGNEIPQLAFGLYLVPDSEEGEEIVLKAIQAGYRHFDTASYYGNEAMLGRAIQKSGVPRSEFYISSKVWNDAIKGGRAAVRQSVENSLRNLQCNYLDLMLVHWPVPGHFVEAYKELEELYKEGKLKGIGLSNFSPDEYEELVKSNITVTPVLNQFEVSPFMYRPNLVQYFQDRKIAVAASKSLNRATCLENEDIALIAQRHSVTPAQVLLRWSFQKGLIVCTKTSNPTRMAENRSLRLD